MQVHCDSLNVDQVLHWYVLPVIHIALYIEPCSYCSTVFTCYILEFIFKILNNLENYINAKYVTLTFF
jgi:hypothetical protein